MVLRLCKRAAQCLLNATATKPRPHTPTDAHPVRAQQYRKAHTDTHRPGTLLHVILGCQNKTFTDIYCHKLFDVRVRVWRGAYRLEWLDGAKLKALVLVVAGTLLYAQWRSPVLSVFWVFCRVHQRVLSRCIWIALNPNQPSAHRHRSRRQHGTGTRAHGHTHGHTHTRTHTHTRARASCFETAIALGILSGESC